MATILVAFSGAVVAVVTAVYLGRNRERERSSPDPKEAPDG